MQILVYRSLHFFCRFPCTTAKLFDWRGINQKIVKLVCSSRLEGMLGWWRHPFVIHGTGAAAPAIILYLMHETWGATHVLWPCHFMSGSRIHLGAFRGTLQSQLLESFSLTKPYWYKSLFSQTSVLYLNNFYASVCSAVYTARSHSNIIKHYASSAICIVQLWKT